MSKIIDDTYQFEKALRLVSNVFNSEERLPNQVFKVPFQNTVIIDFDHAMSSYFWNELEKLTDKCEDSFVIMAVLEPDPVNYYYKEFSKYNWCLFQKGTTVDEYWNTLKESPVDSPADAIVSNSEVVLWLPSSMKWAVWGERSYGICVLGFNEVSDYKSESWFTMDRAITDLVSLNFKDNTVPEEVSSKLMKFYSNIK
ncbi:hypothetical protein M5X06_30685 [Paenibacillus alvei]|uniref:Uncharacterized protein n=1 Tax=Paenibacillus alvei TaxID=44250 RepID=A0ABT4H751_PAEAL|nr:hypothetical protein [Paenibacillus alvei]MCY9764815.1 hypothetical protein [Paenibacillus alvei]MCY9771142.1 hypothetical protein [Paenibacillus alvei]